MNHKKNLAIPSNRTLYVSRKGMSFCHIIVQCSVSWLPTTLSPDCLMFYRLIHLLQLTACWCVSCQLVHLSADSLLFWQMTACCSGPHDYPVGAWGNSPNYHLSAITDSLGGVTLDPSAITLYSRNCLGIGDHDWRQAILRWKWSVDI